MSLLPLGTAFSLALSPTHVGCTVGSAPPFSPKPTPQVRSLQNASFMQQPQIVEPPLHWSSSEASFAPLPFVLVATPTKDLPLSPHQPHARSQERPHQVPLFPIKEQKMNYWHSPSHLL